MSYFVIPDIGCFDKDCGFIRLEECSDGFHKVGKNGVVSITSTGDRKAEFIAYEDKTIAYVKSSMGYPAYYPVHEVKFEKPLKAVLNYQHCDNAYPNPGTKRQYPASRQRQAKHP